MFIQQRERYLEEYFGDFIKNSKKNMISIQKHEYIAFEDFQTSNIYVVSSGVVKLSTFLCNGNEFNIKVVTDGSIVTLLEDENSSIVNNPYSICALSETAEILLLDRLDFWNNVKHNQILNEYVRAYYRKNLNFQIRKTCALTSNGKLGAVCELLNELQLSFGQTIEKGTLINLNISNEELAKFCGIYNASSFNRILRKLRELNILETYSNKILIKDLESLVDFTK
ncbi:Crp/Fnr family transcriptional regulator [Enterococcus devriesei]|uniref:Crp/Fnr family transcriptional regulator n=1 Tax=Enterococcus devriesei TaxID=319970 RepID=UPI0036D3817A